MPRIFDNITAPHLVSALQETLGASTHADYCVGYFNLRGWKSLDGYVERWSGGNGQQCRLLIGMQTTDEDELRRALSLSGSDDPMDNRTATLLRLKRAESLNALP